MKKIINLKPQDYYTQRNNELYPKSACMPTARAMFYQGNNIKFKNDAYLRYDSYLQDDDFFMSLLETREAYDFAKKKYPNLIESGYHPYEIHGMYNSWLDEKVTGKRRSDFKTDLTWNKIIELITAGQVIMTSGKFPESGINGHAFCIIGLINGALGPALIIADPWGDFRTNYKSKKGYAVVMNEEEFKFHVKPLQELKWGHCVL